LPQAASVYCPSPRLRKNSAYVFIAPAEVQEKKLKRRLRGYSREDVERLLDEVVASYDQVWRERDELRTRVEQLEKELAPLRDAERHLSESLLTAERAGAEVRERAEEKAEALLQHAREQGKEAQRAANRQRDELNAEIRRLELVERELQASLRAFLLAGLELVEDREAKPKPPVVEVPAPSHESPTPA
jgi:cell division initiation protein